MYTGGDEQFDFAFDKMPSSGYAKTYCVDAQVADSACTGTAYHTGVKTLMGHIGMDSRAASGDCTDHANKAYQVEAISKWAIDAGMDVGLITTSRVTDASPSPLYASSSTRFFETDKMMEYFGCDPDKLEDIAEQMIHKDLAKKFKVILGGGRDVFLDQSITDDEGAPGARGDGKNLIKEWQDIHQKMGTSKYVWNREQLLSLDTSKVDYVLGLFEGGYMKYNHENTDNGEPSLSEMVKVAIEILSRNEKGYYLFVEGGRIDHGHHATMARVALDETKYLGEALDKARELTSENDTLLVLSADHAHTMTYSGYSVRRNDILGLTGGVEWDPVVQTTLGYAIGNGFKNTFSGDKYEPVNFASNPSLGDFDFEYPAMMPSAYETHAADDVPVYAGGPHHEIFSGAYEQNALPYLMAYAAKIGPYENKKERSFAQPKGRYH